MIQTADMLKFFQPHRGDALVIPGRGGRHWVDLSTRPELDAPLSDPGMGGHAPFAFGLALAHPERRVVLFDSEGDLLMNLGILATIAEQNPKNFYHFLLDNECYATTGGQPVPNGKHIDYAAIARACGYPRALAYDDLEPFSRDLGGVLAEPGPVFVSLKVFPEIVGGGLAGRMGWMKRTRLEVLADLRGVLASAG